MTPNEAAANLERLKRTYVYSTIGGIGLSLHPRRDQLLKTWDLPADGTLATGRIDGTNHSIPLVPYFQPGWGEGLTNLEIVRSWAAVIALTIGQRLKQVDDLNPLPLYEFARHIRNAVAHGDAFSIQHMKGPAEFGRLRIDKSLNGTPLWDFLRPGDVLALLDSVIAELGTSTATCRTAPSQLPKE